MKRIEFVLEADDEDDQREDIENLFREVLKLEELRRGGPPKRPPRQPRLLEIPPDARAVALARIHAAEAARLEPVERFREDVLEGQLLSSSEVPGWIAGNLEEQAGQARLVRRWEELDGTPIRVPDLSEYGFDFLTRSAVLRRFAARSRTVRLLCPGESLEVRPDSVLGRLKFIAALLEERYSWLEPHSVEFVLAGTSPPPFQGRLVESRRGEDPRILIEIAPRVTPKELAHLYRAMREPERRGVRSERRIELAAFAAERNDGRRWKDAMEEWNRLYPDWRCEQLSNFRRDCREAYHRLTGGRKLGWRRRRGAAGHVTTSSGSAGQNT